MYSPKPIQSRITRKNLTVGDNLFITHKSVPAYYDDSTPYETLFRSIIFEFDQHQNFTLLGLGMRLLFTLPMYIKDLQDDEWYKLVDKLINWVKKLEEPLPTYAIQCLEIIFYLNYRDKPRKLEGLDTLAEILIYRSIILSQSEPSAPLVSIPFIEPLEIITKKSYFEENIGW
ncbi:hypothetical protein HZS_3818 [Henneguya salminicola]|nr:hypothetical protein HZS_3818 [Henneguya salminicola]